MGIYNFIETFFFLSLGITFVLILLLVYHFKQRLTSLEQKSDTMFEIINNIVKEITFMKNMSTMANSGYTIHPHPNLGENMESARLSNNVNHPNHPAFENLGDYVEDGSEYDEESEDDEQGCEDEHSEYEDSEDNDEDSEDNDEDSEDEAEVKIINLDMAADNLKLDDINEMDENELLSEDEPHLTNIEFTEEPIVVHKVEDHLEIPSVQEPPTEQKTNIYQNMSLPELKTLVITKGLCTDPSKMKKAKLLKLLEDVE
jgi:hypothetical protein